MIICEKPSALTDRRLFTPAMEMNSSSNLSVTSISMVPGEAPSRTVSTVTIGTSTLGNRSILILLMEIKPSPMSAPTIIMASTGRRIQRSAIHIGLV